MTDPTASRQEPDMDVPSGETRTHPDQPTGADVRPGEDRAILANTIRALELLGKSHDAYSRGDADACDAIVRQAHQECGADVVSFIGGGMRIGEIPTPDSEHWHDYVQHQRDRLAAMTAATGCTAEVSDHTCTCLTNPPTAAPHAKH